VRRWRWDAQDRAALVLTGHFSVQAAEKLLLAEGSKLALVGFQGSYDQGVYGLVANLGSLVVRLLFTPIEEAAFTAFSRCVGGVVAWAWGARLLAVWEPSPSQRTRRAAPRCFAAASTPTGLACLPRRMLPRARAWRACCPSRSGP
jgi:oligosaccharide translocation protein RFT1